MKDFDLNPTHYAEIVENSGVSNEIACLNFWTITDPSEADRLLNRNSKKRWQHSEHLVPAWAVAGIDPKTGERWFLGVQLKPDTLIEIDGKPQKYLSVSGQGTESLFLDNGESDYWPRILSDRTIPLFITEGAKKAACLLTLGYAAISLPGVWNGQIKGRLKNAIKQFCGLGRKVYLCFDSDQMTNPKVQQALDRLGRLLIAEGCIIFVMIWDSQHKGIDDLRVQAGAEAIEDAITSSLTFEEWRDRVKIEQRRQTDRPDEDGTKQELSSLIALNELHKPELFAETLATPLKNLAHRLNLPVEAYTCCLLPIVGSVLKVGTRIEIDPATNFYAPPIVWIGLVGESGTRKSPILKALMEPLNDLQAEAEEDFQRAYKEYECQLLEHEARPKRQRTNGKQTDEQQNQRRKPNPPNPKEYFLSDFTLESLAQVISYQKDQGLLVHVDELAGFFKSMDAYRNGKGGDRQHWLTFYDGGSFKVNRKSTGRLYTPRTSISIVGSIQPSVIQQIIMGDKFLEDGLWPRFAWVKIQLAIAPGISDGPRFDLSQLLKGLYHSLNTLPSATYKFSKEAQKIWNQWHSGIEHQVLKEPSGLLRGTYPKAKERAARIALIIHLANAALCGRSAEQEISSQTLTTAIQFTKWLMGQTHLLYAEIEASADPEVARILKFVQRFKGCSWVNASRVRAWWTTRRKPTLSECRIFMSKVVRLGYAIAEETSDSPKFQIQVLTDGSQGSLSHPQNYEEKGIQHRLHSSQNGGQHSQTESHTLSIGTDYTDDAIDDSAVSLQTLTVKAIQPELTTLTIPPERKHSKPEVMDCDCF